MYSLQFVAFSTPAGSKHEQRGDHQASDFFAVFLLLLSVQVPDEDGCDFGAGVTLHAPLALAVGRLHLVVLVAGEALLSHLPRRRGGTDLALQVSPYHWS